MSFPYSYSGKVHLFENSDGKALPDRFSLLSKINRFIREKEGKRIKRKEDVFAYTEKDTLFNIEYNIELELSIRRGDYTIFYKIEAEALLKVISAAVVVMAFLTFFSITTYLISALIFAVVFYTANVFFVSSALVNKINKFTGNAEYSFEAGENLSPEQKKWLKNPQLCPACGSFLSDFDIDCPDCGLRVKQNRHSVPLNLSKYRENQVEYHYKKKEDE